MLRDEKVVSATLDSLPGLFYIIDERGRFLRWNSNLEIASGYSAEEISRLTPPDLADPSDRQNVVEKMEQVFRDGAAALETRLLAKDGTLTPYFFTGKRVLIDRKPCLVGMGIDITASKGAERKFHDLLEAAPDASVITDGDGRIVLVNANAETVFGYPRAELLGQKLETLLPARYRHNHRSHVAGYHAKPNARAMGSGLQLFGMRKDGTEFPVEVSLSPIETGEGLLITSAIRDITERKRAEESRQESEEKLRGLYELSPLGIALTTIDGQFVEFNDAFQRICGYSLKELKALDYWALTPRKYEADEARQLASLESTGKYGPYEKEYIRKDGTLVPLQLTGMLITGRDRRKYIWSIVEDITERKRAEARIRYLNRVYATLSGINTLIVRARARDELFREACRIAVEVGGFRMAWVGELDRSNRKITLAACAGSDAATLAAIKDNLSMKAAPLEDSAAAQAIRHRKVIISNDTQDDCGIPLARSCAELGIRSSAILPLIVGNEAVGMIALYAGESEFFHEEELKLLTELAGDISFAIDHIEKQDRLNFLAYYDPLTGLANRGLFLERVAQYARSAARDGRTLAVGLIDLERFKNINDSLGRAAGDALLKQVAEWLTAAMGDAALLARFDADHFCAVLPSVSDEIEVTRFVERSLAAFIDHPFCLNDTLFRINAKVGVALFPGDGGDADTLLKNAEAALKRAKTRGNRYVFYTQAMNDRVAEKLSLENNLRRAIDNAEFVLHYQPKVSLATGALHSAEALIRWNDPRTGLVPPGRFIPILEETGLINVVGRWALRKALDDYLRWRKAGLPAVRVAVNVSPLQLRSDDFIAEIKEAVGIEKNAAAGLELEITESLIMEDVKHSIAALHAIRALGVSIAIDDFGTGFSSLSYLAKLPVDTLKIDRSFVIDMTAGPQGLALVSTVISLAHSLKLKVVAEGVETEEQRRLLQLLGCDEMQGYLFSKPVPCEAFEAKFLSLPAGNGVVPVERVT